MGADTITTGFAAPDGKTAWLLGFASVTTSRSLLLKTTDAGATWTDQSSARGAPDADLWLGGDHGTLLYNDRGGR